ncbi:MAG: transposase [Candidatus Pacebacteria bacterium]|nr:transposase [Candidatus Paceibacterota bacterium]MCD8508212.1 transposase [Candidatus Paceibacterota bacterium]MCD8527809.1 transposase [Candidatus Paceibacterota bacterium]MCD8563425.1 transposase [Candidatus Paceibacterota bacterium]
MSKKKFKISKEIKEETINRIKHQGISVAQAAQNIGVSTVTIYSWLGNKAKGSVSVLVHNKLKKENEELKRLIGELTIRMSMEAKKGPSRA